MSSKVIFEIYQNPYIECRFISIVSEVKNGR